MKISLIILQENIKNKMIIFDRDLNKLFENKIIQYDNSNRNSEVFIHDNKVLKIYTEIDKRYKHNLEVIKEIFKKQKYLKNIKELVLPQDIIFYNNNIVGFTMALINGITLDKAINDNLLTEDEIKNIFIKILHLINKLKKLPFNFQIGDLHEKNVIIDRNLNIYIIDCDSFIINNKKLKIDNQIIIGKYPNHYFNNQELKNNKLKIDYFCLLSMILNYVFKDVINDSNPLNYVKKHTEFNELNYLIKRLDNPNEFYLTEQDIDNIFRLKNKIIIKENPELEKELSRIRKIQQKN